jgi:hypothetical protein
LDGSSGLSCARAALPPVPIRKAKPIARVLQYRERIPSPRHAGTPGNAFENAW